MKKVIALSAVLVFGALGMACDGGTTPNTNGNSNKTPANVSTPVAVNTSTPMNTTPANTTGTNTTGTNTKMNSNTNDKK
jgi:hypothetical protein